MKKKTKTELRQDSVNSETIHIGIELETYNESLDGSDSHNDEACHESRRQSYDDESTERLLMDYIGLSRSEASSVSPYFDRDSYIDDLMSDYSCDDDDCCFKSDNNHYREELRDDLRRLTGNRSFKVESDGSISTDGIDMEICWNYYISKETIKDNARILKAISDHGNEFNTSCGLHINLNNYLELDNNIKIETEKLSFLFNIVADSRRTSNYCKEYAHSGTNKYSMLYNQGDRVEFRFFSPTFDAEKLNNYVRLAHHVYKRLAGIDCKLPKKLAEYFIKKMIETNNRSESTAIETIDAINSIGKLESYIEKTNKYLTTNEVA